MDWNGHEWHFGKVFRLVADVHLHIFLSTALHKASNTSLYMFFMG